MCLGIPGRVLDIVHGTVARVDVAGVVREIDLGLLDGPFVPGDYILVHSGYALERMSEADAADALTMFVEQTPAPPDRASAQNPPPDGGA